MDDNLQEVLMPLIIGGTFATMLILFTKTITDYLLKRKIVSSGLESSELAEILKNRAENKYATLKWGLIILSGGIGLLLLEFIPFGPESPLPFGIMAICISSGFLAYYLMVRKENNK